MSATAFERALDETMFERLCQHEGDLAAAILLGLDVVGADAKRTDLSSPPSDPDEAAGAVYYRRDPNAPDYPRKVALVSLLGPLHEGEPGWPPPWPLDPASTDDERKLATSVKRWDSMKPATAGSFATPSRWHLTAVRPLRAVQAAHR
jgi:hypothetical protein